MSKATIQMCMSTTGFGPQALRVLPQQYHAQTSPTTTYPSTVDADTDMQGYMSSNPAGYLHHPQQQRRPVPRFDMNLKDLFSDDETDKRSFSRVSNQVNAMRPPPNPMKSEQMQPFTADLKISPQMRTTHQSQQNFFASPNQQNNAFSTTTPPANPPMPSPYQIPASLPYTAFSQTHQNVNSAYPDLGFSDLDFLDSFPSQGSGGAGGGSQDVGIGFGMGFGDGTHDWSDGNGLDLFDGFFFGKYIYLRGWGLCEVKCANGIQGLEVREVRVSLWAWLCGSEAARRRRAFVRLDGMK
jgi:hypothetical protein